MPSFVIIFNGKEIDLQDSDEPIQTYYSYDVATYKPGIKQERKIDFQVNDFYDYNDILGFFLYDLEPYSYFSIDSKS